MLLGTPPPQSADWRTGATPAMYYPYLMNYYPPSRVSLGIDYWTDMWLNR